MTQLSLDTPTVTGPSKRRAGAKVREELPQAISDPVARVVVDVPIPSVDRVFEYLVPERLSEAAVPGVRVRVRFSGRLVDGFLLTREPTASHPGRLTMLSKVVGVPVLSPDVAELARAVADRYAGTLADVLRDAVPPRHARAERGFLADYEALRQPPGQPGDRAVQDHASASEEPWGRYVGGERTLGHLRSGEQVRAALIVSPADDPTTLIADLVGATDGAAIVVVPDARDQQRFACLLRSRFGSRVAELSAASDPADRYRTFLKIKTGVCDIVVGTRHAVFAPAVDVSLLVLWDDGDDNLCEQRSPGWHAREVMALRSLAGSSSLVLAGHSQSVDSARLVSSGWLRLIARGRDKNRLGVARVVTLADDPATRPERGAIRVPHVAWQVIHDAIRSGPVLVQVARSGYVTALVCQQCREPAACSVCSGPLGSDPGVDGVTCRWCGELVRQWSCASCGQTRLRPVSVGSTRTAADLARAFPDVPVRTSGRASGVIDRIGSEPAIVVATVDAEPVADGGYQGAVLLDGSALLARTELRSEEQTVRRWFNVMALVRGADQGGKVAVTMDPTHRAVQALVRMDPIGWAARELDDRRETGLPPVTRSLTVTGEQPSVADFLTRADLDPGWRVLGPVPVPVAASSTPARTIPMDSVGPTGGQRVRVLVLAPIADGPRLATAAKAALSATADRGSPAHLHIRIDPTTLL